MKRLACFVVIIIIVLSLEAAGVPAKLAVVPGGDPKPDALLALAEAKLFEHKDIEMLERTEIDKVLAEQKLSGMFDATNAVELGRILKTDIFAALETTSIVIFDAQTGLRFVDETLPEQIEDTAGIVSDAVKTAVKKRNKFVDGNLVTFGVLEVRNADFPVDRDAWCRAIAGMLERSLLHRGAAVLERSRLQHVNRERQLTGDATNDLLASMKLIDLEFTRGEAAKTFKITARIGDDIFRAESLIDKPLDAVHKLAGQLLEADVTVTADSASEAARFAKEALFSKAINRLDDALENIETAVALAPEELGYRIYLVDLLVRQMGARMTRFKWDNDLGIYRVDAGTMKHDMQEFRRVTALLESFPPIYSRSQYNDFAQRFIILTTHLYPEYKDEVLAYHRGYNRRAFDRWFKEKYQPTLDRVVDRKTFRIHLDNLNPLRLTDLDALSPLNSDDYFAAPLYKIMENSLRLTREYPLEVGDPYLSNDSRDLAEFYQVFTDFVWGLRTENIDQANPQAAEIVEQTLAMMEQDSRLMPQNYAWIARNRSVEMNMGNRKWKDSDRLTGMAYYEKIKSYLAERPKKMTFYESDPLYHEMAQIIREIDKFHGFNRSRYNPIPFVGEIIELADSRNELASDAVRSYIGHIHNIVVFCPSFEEDAPFMELKRRFDPVVLRQIALAKQMGFAKMTEYLSVCADRACITASKIAEATKRPGTVKSIGPFSKWTSEVDLFPKNDLAPKEEIIERANDLSSFFSPVIRNGVFYCALRNGRKVPEKIYLGCVDLETLERRYIPFPDNVAQIGTRLYDHGGIRYIDKENIYFSIDSESGGGLLIYPLDGSESWTLTLQDGLPSDKFRFLGELDGKCYAIGVPDWIIRIDPKARQWELLSSNRAKEGETPFVDGRRLVLQDVIEDTAQERLLFTENWSLWAIERDGKFVQLYEGTVSPLRLIGLFENGTKLLLYGDSMFIYDFETGDVSKKEGLYAYLETCFTWNGHIWGGISETRGHGWKWGRCRIGGGSSKTEMLPIPETITTQSSDWLPSFGLPTPDDKNLIVGNRISRDGDGGEMVLLRFEHNASSPLTKVLSLFHGDISVLKAFARKYSATIVADWPWRK